MMIKFRTVRLRGSWDHFKNDDFLECSGASLF